MGTLPPLLPYLFSGGVPAVAVSASISAVALFAIGALKAIFTRLSWLRSGPEMVGIGVLATLFTYFIGRLFGVQLS